MAKGKTLSPPDSALPNQNAIASLTRKNVDVFSSEGSRTELIIAPILMEIYQKYAATFSFWVQKVMSADPMLSGVPDYMFGTKSPLGKTVLESPLVLIGEAKKNDFEQGWGQCLAELVAAQIINQNTAKPVYGIVTDGLIWRFGRTGRRRFHSGYRHL